AGRDNFTSPADMLLLLQALDKGDVTGAAGKDEILAAMKLNEERDKIQAELPGNISVAHKTGTIDNVEHDAGIVYLPNRPYYLVLMSNNVPNATGIAAIGQASGIIYRWFSGPN
nr:class A beta-lactamase-related serine hydrolase [Chloroflexaceae bacterium]